uniref:DUF5710 domain-containing protein n=1 Tax=Macrostomum lignano TaxID=282301 RepID=A0A1I8FL55_9PLAT
MIPSDLVNFSNLYRSKLLTPCFRRQAIRSKVPELHPELPPVFRFEGNKNLLYTIKSNIGEKVYTTFKNRGNNEIPSDRSLPKLYRSDQLDTLANAVERSGFKHIVAEMRAGSRVVAQVVFDVSINTKSLNFQNWFTRTRMVSSFPYKLKKTGFNFFSFAEGRGCGGDIGFWFISDRKDVCKWSNKGWHSSGPVLVYTQVPGVPFAKSNAYYADRFIVYMAETRSFCYTIKSHIGKTAYSTFRSRAYDRIPKHRSLPDLYRSNQLDTLPSLIHRTGYKRMVAEMRTDGKVVAQVVFDVSRNPNWARAATTTTYFSFCRAPGHKRTSLSTGVTSLPGCDDIGFWGGVGQARDPMQVGRTRLAGRHLISTPDLHPDSPARSTARATHSMRIDSWSTWQGHRAPAVHVKSGRGPRGVSKTFRTKAPATSRPTAPCRPVTAPTSWTRWPGPSSPPATSGLSLRMRSDGRRVAQVVSFDVSRHTKSVGMTKLVHPTRLVSSYPLSPGQDRPTTTFFCRPARPNNGASSCNKAGRLQVGQQGLEAAPPRCCVYTKKPGKYRPRQRGSLADRFLVYWSEAGEQIKDD